MRFSRSNTFFGNPVGYDVVLQWAETIRQNVRADSFVGGQPTWFMSRGPDNTLWYVEVTPTDYQMVLPRGTADVDSDDSDDEREPVNTHDLTDNCYYVTAAALAGTTTNDLINRTGVMQVAGGVYLDAIVDLFKAAGLSSTYHPYSTFEAAETGMAELAGGLDKKFGFRYDRSNNTGHMVVATYDATEQEFEYYDYQIDADGRDDASRGQNFHVFPQ
jgi:hypothetical protein